MRDIHGQATVEVVAILPVVVVVGAAVFCALAAGRAEVAARAAAHAGAMAALQGGDAGRAARRALESWPVAATLVRVDGTRVRVRVRPRLPVAPLERRLQATAVADPGPTSSVDAVPATARGGDGRSGGAGMGP